MSEIPKYSWSFSSLGLFQCPKQYEIVRAKKIILPPQSEAGNEGSRLHALIEDYFKTGVMDDEIVKWKRILEAYYAKGGEPEVEYAFKWVPYDGMTEGYYQESTNQVLVRCAMDDPDVWFRAILDWVKVDEEKDTAEVADWKTGRVKPSKQLQLYAWIIFLAHPTINRVKCVFQWLNHNDQLPQWFERKDMEKLFSPFKTTLDEINSCYRTDIWYEIPGEIRKSGRGANCTYCPVTIEYCSMGLPLEKKDGN